MTVDEILGELQSHGNEKVFAHNIKYGASQHNQFGVKMGDIRIVAKKIKTNHELALELWKTGNIEARLLATLIVKPELLSLQELDEMARSIDFAQLADWFNAYVLKEHPEKERMREAWMNGDNTWAARSGWSLTAAKIAKNPSALNLDQLLNRIEKEMPQAAPETQWTMNTALAYIGIHHPQYRKRAIEIGENLGLYRDYPVSKGCISPFAPIWIIEMSKRKQA